MATSKLRKAIAAGLRPGGDLAERLIELGDCPIETCDDANCVCDALGRFPLASSSRDELRVVSPLHALVALFQQGAATARASELLAARGIPELCRIFDESIDATGDEADVDALLFLLKILAMYRTYEGTARVAAAARRGFYADRFMWSVILGQYGAEHPHWPWLCDQLRDPLPRGFLAVAYLDMVNQLAIAGELPCHPFDSPEGKARLGAWLGNSNSDEFSYAHSATASLPFISPPERDQLLALAMDHAESGVQLEAAWASARLGSEGGVKMLGRYCLDPRRSRIACQYLEELQRDDAIPAAARDPDFQAVAEMCHWLSHPNEFGRPPDDVGLYDSRVLYWPPADERRRLWLVRYRFAADGPDREDETGVGIVGSVTFALFGEVTADLPPDDVYALYCCWELEWQNDARAPKRRSVQAGRRILARYNPSGG